MIAPLAAVFTVVFIGVGAVVGVRLLWLARRTRGLPELTLGLGLFLIVGVGYPISLAAPALGVESAIARGLVAFAVVVMGVGWMGMWVFNWRVFRPEHAGARLASLLGIALLAACAAVRVVGVLRATEASDLERVDAGTLGYQVSALAVYAWGATESWLQWRRGRRRLCLGLADPVVVNRFGLFFLMMLACFTSVLAPFLGGLAGVHLRHSPGILLGSALSGLVCSVTLVLAFLPPRAYLERVRRGAAPA